MEHMLFMYSGGLFTHIRRWAWLLEEFASKMLIVEAELKNHLNQLHVPFPLPAHQRAEEVIFLFIFLALECKVLNIVGA